MRVCVILNTFPFFLHLRVFVCAGGHMGGLLVGSVGARVPEE